MAVIVCGASWKRVRADHHALSRAMSELNQAQARRYRLRVFGRGNLTKAQRKAVAAVTQAIAKVKAASARMQRSERVWANCSRRS